MAEPHRPPVERRRGEPDPAAVAFVLRLARALHDYGYAAHRLEEVLGVAAERLGLAGAQFSATPTLFIASFGPEAQQRTFVLRLHPGNVDLGKLAELDAVSLAVLRGRLAPAAGSEAIARIVAAPPRYGGGLTVAAFGIASGAACRFLNGGIREIVVATVIGIAIGLLALVAARSPRFGRVFEPTAAFTASLIAGALAARVLPFSVFTATLSGLIVMLPGLTLTTAMTELATGHLVSGTARLSGAFITLFAMAFGVALGGRLSGEIFGAAASPAPIGLSDWTGYAALVIAPLCFTIILRAEPRDAPWILLAGALGVAGGRLGAQLFGLELGMFVGSLMVGIAGSVYGRVADRPIAVVTVPGILLLVPGSIGFRSLTSLMERQVVAGVETAFTMVITAVALVAGLLIANVVAPERRLP